MTNRFRVLGWLRAWGLVVALLAVLSAGEAGAQISFIGDSGISGGASAVATLSLSRSSGAAGDLLIAQIVVRGGTATTITPPSGWTLIRRDNSGTTLSQAVYYKVMGSGEPSSYGFGFSPSAVAVGELAVYRGVDTSNPIANHGGQANGSSTSVTAPGVNAGAANSMLLGLFATANGGAGFTPATGMTEREDRNGGSGGSGAALSFADQTLTSIGPTSTRVATASASAVNLGALIALQPALTVATPRLEHRFDELGWSGASGEVLDSSGNARHGTAAGTADTTAGLLCNAADLSPTGTGDYVTIPSTVLNGVGDFTIVLYGKTSSINASAGGVATLHAGGATSSNEAAFKFESSTLAGPDIRTTVGVGAFTIPNIADNAWHQLVWVRQGANHCIYTDGTLRNCVTQSGGHTGALSVSSIVLGQEMDCTGGCFVANQAWNGLLDELLVFGQALGPGQVSSINNNITTGKNWDGTARTCPSALHHIRILHDGSALTCAPETVTVQACADANCTSLHTGSVTTTLSPAGWVGGDTITFSGGSTTVQLRKTATGSVTLGAASTTPTPSNATRCFIGATESCTLTFADAGFVFDVPTLTACKPSAAITVSAVRTDDVTQRCVPAFASVTRSVSFWSTYANPATGTQAVSVNGSAVAGASPGTAISLTFDANAQATITVTYPDAGQMQLNARYTGSGAEAGLIMNGTDGFVVVPAGLAVYSDDANATCTPASATCSILAKAGDPFALKVKAACWQSDGDTDLSDNAATANFRMSAIPMTSALQAPASGAAATLGTSSFDFVAGDTGIHVINQTVSEVGVFRFTATPAAAAYFGATVAGGTSANIGRFTPHHFSLSATSLVNRSDIGAGTGCSPASSFTYLGEPQRLTFTLTAQNAGGGTTQNYNDAGGFAKLAPATASWPAVGINSSFGLGAINDPANPAPALRTPLSSRLAVDTSIASPSGTWVAGTLATGAHVRVDRAAAPDGPFGLVNFGLAPRDGDGITLASSALNLDADQNGAAERANFGVTTALRFGRAALDNAHGSELLDLPVRLRLQHWNGVGFVDSGDDACTTFAASDFALSFPADSRNHLAACETRLSLAGGLPSTLKLLKPGAGNDGWVDVRLNLSAASGQTCTGAAATAATTANKGYLQGRWSGTAYNQDPTARATFGVYKASGSVIYLRENY